MWSNVEAVSNCPAPTSRSKHAVCVSSNNNGCIYLLGGRSANLPLKDFWKFDPAKNVWEEVRTRGHCPPSLQEHTMLSWKNSLYVFGGEIGFASTGETPLWILDLGTLVWRKVVGTSSHQPSGRRGHSAITYGGSMFIYGGYQDLRGSSSELWSLDLTSERWHLILGSSCIDHPPPRHSHSCVVHEGAMWIYGGLTDLQPRCDLWKWDFEIQEWFRMKVQRGPGELFGHAAFKVADYMFVFGGERIGNCVNELWRYSFATEIWERIAAEGVSPPSKCRQVAIVNPSAIEEEFVRINQQRAGHLEQNECYEMHQKKPYHPPKSLSMCFSQQNNENSRKRNFKFKVHPTVSRLCSKNTSSDEDDEDEYTVGYNHNAGQVNLRSLRDRISSSRLVRSISSGSYSILHNQSVVDGRHGEMERLMETKSNSHEQQRPRFTIQKSQSSDAVLESDSDVHVPKCKPLIESNTGVPLWVENPNASLSPTSWSDGHQLYSHHHRFSSTNNRVINGDHTCNTPAVRPSRLSYDGPLSTVKDVEEENSENADEANMVIVSTPKQLVDINGSGRCSKTATEILVDLDGPEVEHERARYPSRFASSYTVSELLSQSTTPNFETRGLPHSASHSSGYHSFTDDECDSHKEFAGCLNTASARKKLQNNRDVELKTFTHLIQTPTEFDKTPSNPFPTHSIHCKERARSWDRSYQRKPFCIHPSCGSLSPTPCAGTADDIHERTHNQNFPQNVQSRNSADQKRGRRLSRTEYTSKIEHRSWDFSIYLFGGPEQEAPGLYRQPISIWKLYL